MRYLLIILSLLSLSFSQLLLSDEDIAKMSNTEKLMFYNIEKKSPTGALLRETFIPTLGYAYIDDWNRGLYFSGGKLFCISLSLQQAIKAANPPLNQLAFLR